MEQLVTSARVVCRSKPRVGAISHVCELLASFLAPPDSWTIERAISSGLRRLALYLIERLSADPDRHYLDKRAYVRVEVMPEAAAVGDIALLDLLVTRFGCCVNTKAIEVAAMNGQLLAFEWLVDLAVPNRPDRADAKDFTRWLLQGYFMNQAAGLGHLEILQWVSERVGGSSNLMAASMLPDACSSGQLHILAWAQSVMTGPLPIYSAKRIAKESRFDVIFFLYVNSMLPLASDVMDAVAGSGPLELLQSMYASGADECTTRGIEEAASAGRVDSVRWLASRGISCTERAVTVAAENGHLEVLRFLLQSFPGQVTPRTFSGAVQNNHLAVAQHLFHHRREICSEANLDDTAANGNLEMIKWLHISCPDAECTSAAMDGAAASGHRDVVEFLHENRTEGCTTAAMDKAAANGFLEMVEWLHFHRTEGCTTKAMDRAAKSGHLDVVKWLHLHRNEGCTTKAMDSAAQSGHLDVVKFLHRCRTEGCTALAMNAAATRGHFEIMQFLHANRTEGCTTWAMDNAANLKILRWLGENRHEGFSSRALMNAAHKGSAGMLDWLHERTPAEMWTKELAYNADRPHLIEAIEWFVARCPEAVEAMRSDLTRHCYSWAPNFLKRRAMMATTS